jgi:hypothetical protein
VAVPPGDNIGQCPAESIVNPSTEEGVEHHEFTAPKTSVILHQEGFKVGDQGIEILLPEVLVYGMGGIFIHVEVLVYELDNNLRPLNRYYIGDPEEVKKAMEKVANQGKAKK